VDILNAFNAFWARDMRSFNHLNEAFMILLKKKAQPMEIRDYQPISLIHSFSKLITKCLARRLAPFLDSLVMKNQSAFIKGRRIHDSFRQVQLACRTLHTTHIPALLLKIDITKAFDTVSWAFLLEVLQHMGFGQRWRDWISVILSTSSTKILLNGQPGRRICHVRALRQGDPLSPMLFVLVMEVLNRFLLWIEDRQFLTPLRCVAGSRVNLYMDDLVLFVAPQAGDLWFVKAALAIFGLASGLFSNMEKSVASPIHCSDHDVARVQDILSCRVEEFPCLYLGIPLLLRKLRRSNEQHLIDKVAACIPT